MSNEPQRKIDLDCGSVLLRTAKPEDASDRWAGWLSDPRNARLVNAALTPMTRTDVAAYIGRFDQRDHLLIVIVDKENDGVIGFIRIDIDRRLKRCLISMMIGEQPYRHRRLVNEFSVVVERYLFETLGLDTLLATVLASNRAMVRYLTKLGWVLDNTAARHVKSQTSNEMLDLCYMRLTRDAFRNWIRKH
jgi:RimJ/RimL family protein N-acetyltransferase